ncbi:MAG: tRNA uridine-5-carboxymethylaminomethyl(34) synthesis enzyme MnmG, partial [Eubacteriales bacterium]|nr:tRNA uridine-5-carboxymethylaminomethyl(34) synthesis enzyme MnmG [Eubacteriales bacterium]
SEYRLYLRQDNADTRLMPKGHALGLVTDTVYEKFLTDERALADEIKRLNSETLKASDGLNALLVSKGYEKTESGIRKAELLKRPFITVWDIYALDGTTDINRRTAERAETEIKYEGYIKKELAEVERFKSLEEKKIPPDLDYKTISGLRIEARQKLERLRPESVGRASRISGVSPADISVLLIYMSQRGRRNG